MDLNKEYNLAVVHKQEHGCSAPPYESYEKLFQIAQRTNAQRILEIGTGIGFTALVLATACPNAKIDTIDKDAEHSVMAAKYMQSQGLINRVQIHNAVAEDVLGTLNPNYDLIFFDGYQIHYQFLAYYEALLKSSGILVLGNNHLSSKTSDQFFDELSHNGRWKILERFADTTVAQRK